MNPCEIGLKCPYMGYGEDELICCWPRLVKDIPSDDDETYGLIGEVDCGIFDCDSTLSMVIDAYAYNEEISKAIQDWTDKVLEEARKAVETRERNKRYITGRQSYMLRANFRRSRSKWFDDIYWPW